MNNKPTPKEIILNSCNWIELKKNLSNLGTAPEFKKIKGDVFEYLTKFYLQIQPAFALLFDEIFHHSEISYKIKEDLNLPSPEIGVDLIAKYKDGTFCAIQCKFHQDQTQNVTYDELSTFFSVTERSETYDKLSHRIVCTSANNIATKVRTLHQKKLGFLTHSDFASLNEEDFKKIHDLIIGKKITFTPFSPRNHQSLAIDKAKNFYLNDLKSKGKIIHPCGSGKSLTAYWLARKLNAKKILIALPSLALVNQTLNSWSRQALADGLEIDYIVICSDQDTSQLDDPLMNTHDLGISVTTDYASVNKFLKNETNKIKVVLTTYQSGEVICAASREIGFVFDMGIYDEAHKTTGDKNKKFALLVQDQNISIKKKLFMTATERQFKGDSDNLISMDDENLYGEVIDQLSFRRALEEKPPILCDYKVITVAVTKRDIERVIIDNKLTKANGKECSFIEDGATIAALITHRKLSLDRQIKHTISFHKSIKRAQEFRHMNNNLNTYFNNHQLDTYHVSGKMGTTQRNYELEKFVASPSSIITNARCLTEGVDIPAVDAILFADPKQSLIDIVQASGRAMRTHKSKSLGYIIIPVILDEKSDDKVNDAFRQLVNIVAALGLNDERIIDEAKNIVKTKRYKSNSGKLEFEEYSPDSEINFENLVKNIELKIWDRLSFAKSVVGETEFNKWMKSNTNLSPSSIDKYTNAVRKISNDLVKMELSYSSLEEITQKADLEKLKKQYFSIPQYKALDSRGNGMYSAGFQRLIEFQNFRNQS